MRHNTAFQNFLSSSSCFAIFQSSRSVFIAPAANDMI